MADLYGTLSPEPTELELRNRALARQAAAEGFVLLKNENGALPLQNQKIALYGMGARLTVKGGLGSGSVEERYSVNIEDGLRNAGYEISSQDWLNDYDAEYASTYQAYHDMVEEKVKGLTNPMQIIPLAHSFVYRYPSGRLVTREDVEKSGTDAAIYVLMRQAGECNDRKLEKGDYYLTDIERENLKVLTESYSHTILVINVGGHIDMGFLDEIPGIDAVVLFVQGGEEGGNALADVYEAIKRPGDRFAGAAFTSGSAGTMSAGDLLKEKYPHLKLAVGEALQCPTILENGFGGHRIEGIGDKHIPWIHNVKNTDMAIAIDDEDSQRLLRLFNTPEGQKYLKEELKLSDELIEKLTWLGISGIANVLCCIKMAKYYELGEDDVLCTVLTDSAVMYQSRIEELNEMHGAYNAEEARLDHNLHMLGLKTDSMMELTYEDRKRIHNLKYYTWVEQQARDVKDLNALWYDTKGTWDAVHAQAKELDELINEFNEATGLLKAL